MNEKNKKEYLAEAKPTGIIERLACTFVAKHAISSLQLPHVKNYFT
jgi:hypothetical protein